MEEGYPQKRKPPPIPKRNPNTRLSVATLQRPTSLSRSFDHESSRRLSYPHQRQYSATLPRRNQRLDICAELLNYISELTQELMAETSFTEVSLLEESNEPISPKPCNSHTSIAIQTEDLTQDGRPPQTKGRSIGTQIRNGGLEETRPRKEPASDFAKLHKSPSKPFKDIRKMLKEGSIEGIEEEPPIFKPPPPPVAYVTAQSNVSSLNQTTSENKKPPTKYTHSKVRKCLSTFEPTKSQKPMSQDPSPEMTLLPPAASISSSNVHCYQSQSRNSPEPEAQEQKGSRPNRSLAFTYKAAAIDQCFHQRLSPMAPDKQPHAPNTPPPPPVGKEPPPKIVVEVPSKKHRQNSSCGTTCSCLCLKRQSPCSSPVPSQGPHPIPSPLVAKRHAQYSPSLKRRTEDKTLYNAGGSPGHEAYDALIAEIRAAIKRRQTDLDKDEDTLED